MTAVKNNELAIVGGGMVGLSLAIALAKLGFEITIIEAKSQPSHFSPSFDSRAISFSLTSVHFFKAIGLWQDLAVYATPIKNIHVSEKGRFGATRLTAEEAKLDALGYVILAENFGRVLYEAQSKLKNIHYYSEAQLLELNPSDEACELSFKQADKTHELKVPLVIAADGGRSKIRSQLGIGLEEHDYEQIAVVTNVKTERPHQNTAYERFTKTGPLALLPREDDSVSVVWTLNKAMEISIKALSDQGFLKQLQTEFGYRLGRLSASSSRIIYPLKQIKAQQLTGPRILLMGNAAHNLHPVAAQGLNLSLRDCASLVELLQHAVSSQQDIGSKQLLASYEQQRHKDQNRTMDFAHGLVQFFGKKHVLFNVLRPMSLILCDVVPALKNRVGKLGSGRAGKLPKMSLGVPVESIGEEGRR